MRVLLSDMSVLPENAKEVIEQAGFQVDCAEKAEDVEDPSVYELALGARLVGKMKTDLFTHLKWVQSSSAGYNHLPLDEWKEKNIVFTNARDVFSPPIAEWVVMHCLMFLKEARKLIEFRDHKQWERISGRECEGMTVSIVGIGSIGQAIQKRMEAFGFKVIGVNRSGRAVDGFTEVYPLSQLDEVLDISDFTVITLPLNEESANLFSHERLMAMKDGSYLLNVGRGGIIDEIALIECLKAGKLGGAALDVFEEEPLSENNPIWDAPNLYITAHNSGFSQHVKTRLLNLYLENLERYRKGLDLKNLI